MGTHKKKGQSEMINSESRGDAQYEKTSMNFVPEKETSLFLKLLWEIDENRPKPFWDYAIDVEAKRTSPNEIPPPTLFAFVNEDLLAKITTFRRLIRLLMTYERSEEISKNVIDETKTLKEKEYRFIKACIETPVIQKLHSCLIKKNKAPADKTEFTDLLYKLWFTPNTLSLGNKQITATLFERIFVGKTQKNEYINFNNWLEYYFMELEGVINFNKIKSDGSKKQKNQRILTVDYEWADPNLAKFPPKGSMLIGTTPEFEIALYTLCALKRKPIVDIHVAHANMRMICRMDSSESTVVEMYPIYISHQRYRGSRQSSGSKYVSRKPEDDAESELTSLGPKSFGGERSYVMQKIDGDSPSCLSN